MQGRTTYYTNYLSGLVHTITHIKLPTPETYGICFIISCSSSFVGHCAELSLKWPVNGVLNGLHLAMLNLSRTFSIYFLETTKVFCLLYPWYLHPKDLLGWSQVFHSKRLAKISFQFLNLVGILTNNQHIIYI